MVHFLMGSFHVKYSAFNKQKHPTPNFNSVYHRIRLVIIWKRLDVSESLETVRVYTGRVELVMNRLCISLSRVTQCSVRGKLNMLQTSLSYSTEEACLQYFLEILKRTLQIFFKCWNKNSLFLVTVMNKWQHRRYKLSFLKGLNNLQRVKCLR